MAGAPYFEGCRWKRAAGTCRGPLGQQVAFEPTRLDHAAAQWRRRLLVLAREIVCADGAAELREHLLWLALGMQDLTRLAAKGLPAEYGFDQVQLVVVGDRRQAHDLPILLRQHVAREVVLVQPVHDQHDRTRELVVELAVEGMVVPFIGRLPLRLQQRFLGAASAARHATVCSSFFRTADR